MPTIVIAEHCSRACWESVSNDYLLLFVCKQGAFANQLRKTSIRLVSPVRPSVCMERIDSNRMDFREILYWGDFFYLSNLSTHFSFGYNRTKAQTRYIKTYMHFSYYLAIATFYNTHVDKVRWKQKKKKIGECELHCLGTEETSHTKNKRESWSNVNPLPRCWNTSNAKKKQKNAIDRTVSVANIRSNLMMCCKNVTMAHLKCT
jgi:hypothetical protein